MQQLHNPSNPQNGSLCAQITPQGMQQCKEFAQNLMAQAKEKKQFYVNRGELGKAELAQFQGDINLILEQQFFTLPIWQQALVAEEIFGMVWQCNNFAYICMGMVGNNTRGRTDKPIVFFDDQSYYLVGTYQATQIGADVDGVLYCEIGNKNNTSLATAIMNYCNGRPDFSEQYYRYCWNVAPSTKTRVKNNYPNAEHPVYLNPYQENQLLQQLQHLNDSVSNLNQFNNVFSALQGEIGKIFESFATAPTFQLQQAYNQVFQQYQTWLSQTANSMINNLINLNQQLRQRQQQVANLMSQVNIFGNLPALLQNKIVQNEQVSNGLKAILQNNNPANALQFAQQALITSNKLIQDSNNSILQAQQQLQQQEWHRIQMLSLQQQKTELNSVAFSLNSNIKQKLSYLEQLQQEFSLVSDVNTSLCSIIKQLKENTLENSTFMQNSHFDLAQAQNSFCAQRNLLQQADPLIQTCNAKKSASGNYEIRNFQSYDQISSSIKDNMIFCLSDTAVFTSHYGAKKAGFGNKGALTLTFDSGEKANEFIKKNLNLSQDEIISNENAVVKIQPAAAVRLYALKKLNNRKNSVATSLKDGISSISVTLAKNSLFASTVSNQTLAKPEKEFLTQLLTHVQGRKTVTSFCQNIGYSNYSSETIKLIANLMEIEKLCLVHPEKLGINQQTAGYAPTLSNTRM